MSAPCLVAVDAATDRLCVAATCDGVSVTRDLDPARDHTQDVYRHLTGVMAEAGGSLDRLDAVAFGCGPGSFTGVRIAAAAAQALAFARGLPVCRISSLRLLAVATLPDAGPRAVCVDARMGRVYAGLYSPDGVLLGAERWGDPADLDWPGPAPFVAVGDGWRAHPSLLERFGGRVLAAHPDARPAAADLLALALAEYLAGRTMSAADALPEYLGQMPAVPMASR